MALFWPCPLFLSTRLFWRAKLAEKKIVGKLVNQVMFETDRASLNKALADIKKVKEAMKGINEAKKVKEQTAAIKKQTRQKSDYLVVQKQLDKTERASLKTQEQLSKAREKQARAIEKQNRAIRKQQIEARKAAVGGLVSGTGSKASATLFAKMLQQEAAYQKKLDAAISRRDAARVSRRIRRQEQIDKAHGLAIRENARRSRATRAGEDSLSRQSARRMSMIEADRYGLVSRFGAGANRRFNAISDAFRNGSMDARMYRQQVAGIRRELSAAANAQRGFNGTMKDMRSAFVQATASYTAFSGLMGMADVGKRFESRQAGMLVATGNKEDAANQIAYLDNQIRRLGLDVDIASKGFVQLGVAGKGVLAQDQIRSIFQGLSELGTAVQLDPMRYEKAILAISQIMNKGTLMSEEVKNQLSP